MSDLTDPQAERLSRAEVFKALFEALKDYQSKALDSGYKTLGFMVVALGWLMTSKDTRDFLHSHSDVRCASVGFLVVGGFCYLFMSRRMYKLSQSIAKKLDTLNYASHDVYDHYIIKPAVPVTYSILHLLISGLIAIVGGGHN
jgi:hypothetical protein